MVQVGGGAEVIESVCCMDAVITSLSVGTYVVGAAAASTGYILVKDSTGTSYKLMVQA
jgi:hypothetical protein